MLFIYGEEEGRYEVVDSSDGTSRFYTLGELGEIKESVLGYYGSYVELDWLRGEMAKRALLRGSHQIEELNLCLSESTGLVTCINPRKKIYWHFMESTENMFLLYIGDPIDMSSFDTSHVISMRGMFSRCTLRNIDLSNFDTSRVTDMSGMFYECKSLKSVNFGNMDFSNVRNMYCMFSGCTNLETITSGSSDTSNVENMSGMFSGCESLEELDLSGLDTSNVTDMSHMFSVCKGLETLNVSSFDTRNVKDMSGMFHDCRNLKALDISHFNTQNVISMGNMFGNCMKLEHLKLGQLNTSKVTDMMGMFSECIELRSLDVGSFDMKNVEDITYMFSQFRCSYNYIQEYIDSLYIEYFIGMDNVIDTEETGKMKGLPLLRKMEREVGMDFTSFTEEASYNREVLILSLIHK
ncbi:MAG: DUF285 domain-containing protein [Lachnospiraceae bacterium]|nr:DUF285 domain-containing protein [Lachnospiraceae bacterium]